MPRSRFMRIIHQMLLDCICIAVCVVMLIDFRTGGDNILQCAANHLGEKLLQGCNVFRTIGERPLRVGERAV